MKIPFLLSCLLSNRYFDLASVIVLGAKDTSARKALVVLVVLGMLLSPWGTVEAQVGSAEWAFTANGVGSPHQSSLGQGITPVPQTVQPLLSQNVSHQKVKKLSEGVQRVFRDIAKLTASQLHVFDWMILDDQMEKQLACESVLHPSEIEPLPMMVRHDVHGKKDPWLQTQKNQLIRERQLLDEFGSEGFLLQAQAHDGFNPRPTPFFDLTVIKPQGFPSQGGKNSDFPPVSHPIRTVVPPNFTGAGKSMTNSPTSAQSFVQPQPKVQQAQLPKISPLPSPPQEPKAIPVPVTPTLESSPLPAPVNPPSSQRLPVNGPAVMPAPTTSSTPIAPGQVVEKSPGNESDGGVDITDMDLLGDDEEEGGRAKKKKAPGAEQPEAQSEQLLAGPNVIQMSRDFDYGTYYKMNQDMYKYRARVLDAMALAKELQMPVDESAIDELFYQSNRYKSEFETLYLQGKVEEAFDAYEKARRKVLQGLFLVSPGLQVEGRAIWLDRGSIVKAGSPEGMRALIERLHRSGFNVVFLETVNAGFSIYPSQYYARNPLISTWDPIPVAIEECHKRGMELHAWVWVFAVGNTRHNPLVNQPKEYPGPVLSRPDMAGEAMRMSGGGLLPFRQTEYWLSPASAKARNFLKDAFTEIVTKYPVDGLQLDYIRYPFQSARSQAGYEAYGTARFSGDTGLAVSGLPDGNARKVWAAWKTFQVTSFVKEVSQALKAARPNLKISAAVFPMARPLRLMAIHQDWETWVQNGWIDVLSPMSYTRSPGKLERVMRQVLQATGTKVPVYPGIGIHHIDAADMLDQIDTLRYKVGASGSTMFAYAHLDDPKEELLKKGPYQASPAIIPHHQPVEGLNWLVRDFQRSFARLKETQSFSSAVSIEQLAAIEQSLVQLVNVLPPVAAGPYQPTRVATLTGSTSSQGYSLEALKQAEPYLNTLQTQVDAWLAADQAQFPLRGQYFRQVVTRMHWIHQYALGRIKTPSYFGGGPMDFKSVLKEAFAVPDWDKMKAELLKVEAQKAAAAAKLAAAQKAKEPLKTPAPEEGVMLPAVLELPVKPPPKPEGGVSVNPVAKAVMTATE